MANHGTYAYKSDYTVHPGEYLEEILEVRAIKKKEISDQLGIPVAQLYRIINKQDMLTSGIVIQLERILGVSRNIWNHLNTEYALVSNSGLRKSGQE